MKESIGRRVTAVPAILHTDRSNTAREKSPATETNLNRFTTA